MDQEPRRARIQLVDDDPAVVAVLREVLGDQGFEVSCARDGHAARAWIAHRGPPDPVVTDLEMPGLDGFGLLRTLRWDPATAEVPVIVLTASAVPREQVVLVGARHVLRKPVALARLVAVIHDALDEPKPEQAQQPAPVDVSAEPAET